MLRSKIVVWAWIAALVVSGAGAWRWSVERSPSPGDRSARIHAQARSAGHAANLPAATTVAGGVTTTAAAPGGFSLQEHATYAPGSQLSAFDVKVGDVSGDGRDDIIVATTTYWGAPSHIKPLVYVYRQDANGSLLAPLVLGGNTYNGLSLGDMDNDGVDDIVVSHNAGISTYALNADGSYRYGYCMGTPRNIALLDVDMDGNLDAVATTGNGGGETYYGNGQGGCSGVIGYPGMPSGEALLRTGDVTGDGRPDLVITRGGEGKYYVVEHSRLGEAPVMHPSLDSAYGPAALALGDFDNDGRRDIAMAIRGDAPTQLQIARQSPSGMLPMMYLDTAAWPMGSDAGDLDGDGRDDLVVLHGFNELSVGVYLQGESGLTAESSVAGPGSAQSGNTVAIGDIDSDGCRDVVALSSGGATVFKGSNCAPQPDYSLGTHQTYATGSRADSVAIGDVNGDGRNDVVVSMPFYFDPTSDYHVAIYLQNADGTLAAPHKAPYLSTANTTGLALADLNRDGRMEIIVGHRTGITVLKWGPFRDAPVSARVYTNAWSDISTEMVKVLDVNRDGHLDVVGATMYSSGIPGSTVFLGDGTGNVVRKAQLPPLHYNDLEAGDFNGDGYADLAGQSTWVTNLFYNDGSDDFADAQGFQPNPGNYVATGVLAAGDFNTDGRTDLVMIRDYDHLAMYHQDAGGGLQPQVMVPVEAYGLASMLGRDLDMDGRDDLVTLNGGGRVRVRLQGAGGLGAETTYSFQGPSSFHSQGLAAGDINGDQCPDIAVASGTTGLVVLPGQGCQANADIAVRLELASDRIRVTLDNSGAIVAHSPVVAIRVTLASGNPVLATLPRGCSVHAQAAGEVELACIEGDLQPGAVRTLSVPFSVDSGNSRNLLSVTATASTPTRELRLDNNRATASLRGLLGSFLP